jgi:hypothetical protein
MRRKEFLSKGLLRWPPVQARNRLLLPSKKGPFFGGASHPFRRAGNAGFLGCFLTPFFGGDEQPYSSESLTTLLGSRDR